MLGEENERKKLKKGFFSLFQNVRRFAEPSEMSDTTDDVSPEESPNEDLIETVSDPAAQKKFCRNNRIFRNGKQTSLFFYMGAIR
uniref:hypothetical protein n=1 Tax=Clostridium sp. NkU-1 TaxID=1095009 RepID=UPI0006D14ED1